MKLKLLRPLPDAVHELLGAALDDVEACRANGVRIDMDTWVFMDIGSSVCSVCLAGAAVYNRIEPKALEAILHKWIVLHTWMFEDDVRDKMRALNYLRSGMLGSAAEYLPPIGEAFEPPIGEAIERGDLPKTFDVPELEEGYDVWMAAMRKLQQALKTAGV